MEELDASPGYRPGASPGAALDASPAAALDPSLEDLGDPSPGAGVDASIGRAPGVVILHDRTPGRFAPAPVGPPRARPTCRRCGKPLTDPRQVYDSKACRQAAWRLRKVSRLEHLDECRRVAYADPPYPGHAWRYRGEPTFAGEVDHAALLSHLQTFDGWALSTSARALRALLPLCPPQARVAVWVKPRGVSAAARGPCSAWEAVIYVPARLVRPGVRDFLRAMPARGGGKLVGRKPRRFCAWLFQLLGLSAGDEFFDLYPGTGAVSHAWRELSGRDPAPAPAPAHGGQLVELGREALVDGELAELARQGQTGEPLKLERGGLPGHAARLRPPAPRSDRGSR